MTVEQKKAFSLGPNTYFYKGYFLYRLKYKDDTNGWLVYKKFADARCQDFLFEAKTLPHLVMAINLFKEEIPDTIVPEVAPFIVIDGKMKEEGNHEETATE